MATVSLYSQNFLALLYRTDGYHSCGPWLTSLLLLYGSLVLLVSRSMPISRGRNVG